MVSDDGRQIQLNADGTWVQVARDRFATTATGERVRLRPDGTWSIVRVEDAPAVARQDAAPVTRQLVEEPALFLSHAEIQRLTRKRAKSKHAETRMLFTVEVRNDSPETVALGGDLQASLAVRDSRGGGYEVLSAAPATRSLAPGAQTQVAVVAADAPRWFGIKYLSVEVARGALGNAQRRILSKNMDEVVRRDVEAFQTAQGEG